IVAVLALAAIPIVGQTPSAPKGSRLRDGKPDLNGIWQALNEANYDLQAHMARPAMALRAGPYGPLPAAPVLALGAVGAVPPGGGVGEGAVRRRVGRRYAGRRRHRLQRRNVVRQVGQLSQRRAARRRAVYADGIGRDRVRSDD